MDLYHGFYVAKAPLTLCHDFRSHFGSRTEFQARLAWAQVEGNSWVTPVLLLIVAVAGARGDLVVLHSIAISGCWQYSTLVLSWAGEPNISSLILG